VNTASRVYCFICIRFIKAHSDVKFIFLQLGKQVCAEVLLDVFVDCQTVRLPWSRYSARTAGRKSGGSNAGRDERFSSTRPDLLQAPPILLFNGYRGPFLGVKRPERVVDQSPPYRTEFKNRWRYTSSRPVFVRDVYRYRFNLPCMISRRYLYVENDIGNGEHYITRVVIIYTPPNCIQDVEVGISVYH